jgi:dimethylamine/trimethylamine dehydrogenase
VRWTGRHQEPAPLVRERLPPRTGGFDLICLYGAHGFGIFQHFLSRATNQRSDEYGGSLENRSRFLREVVEDMRDAVGDDGTHAAHVADETIGTMGFSNAEVRDFIEMHRDLPDLWDLAHGTWEDCSGTVALQARGRARTAGARHQGADVQSRSWASGASLQPRRDGAADQIRHRSISSAAHGPRSPIRSCRRRSRKAGIEDIRECIGCNICVTGDMTMSDQPLHAEPAFMEEWRKGWHPEKMNAKGESRNVLVVGAGPAGLEAARALSLRGYDVALAEARDVLGGRVTRERLLPGLSAWGRVVDYRQYQLSQRANVETYVGSELGVEEILEFGFENVCIATGSRWRADGVARQHVVPVPVSGALPVYTPDDIMEGRLPSGKVVVYDDDHYYMGGVLAELLAQKGCDVTLITTSAYVSDWTLNTLEQGAIHRRLVSAGVKITLNTGLAAIHTGGIETNCSYTDARGQIGCDGLVMVASRVSNDALYHGLVARQADWADAGIRGVKVIGDAGAPGPIAWATYAGHRYARELDMPDIGDALPFRREVTALAED